MKSITTPIVATVPALTLAAALAIAQSATAVPASCPFIGTWEGQLNDLPGVTLTVEEAGGTLRGTMVFYFQKRADANSRWHVTGESRVPLLAPRMEGNTLTFEVQHHKCDTCAELGPNVKFRVDLNGPDELRLWKLDDRETNPDPSAGQKLIRQTAKH